MLSTQDDWFNSTQKPKNGALWSLQLCPEYFSRYIITNFKSSRDAQEKSWGTLKDIFFFSV